MKIKKWWIFGSLGLIAISLGMALAIELFETLGDDGWKGYLLLVVFVASTGLYLWYETDLKAQRKIADKVTRDMSREYKKEYGYDGLANFTAEMREELERRIGEDSLELPWFTGRARRVVNTYLKVMGGLVLIGFLVWLWNARELPATIEREADEAVIETWRMEVADEDSLISDYQAILDLDGDGVVEKVVNHAMRGTENEDRLIAYNTKYEIVATAPDILGGAPVQASLSALKLDEFDDREFLRVDTIAGSHQTETMFLEMKDGLLLPVCKVEVPNSVKDCLFYNSRDELNVEDLDGGGWVEVIEMADEYPEPGELSQEEIEAIESEFGAVGDVELIEMAKRVASYEKSRGRPVIWRVYGYNGAYFEEFLGEDYLYAANLFLEAGGEHLKRGEMSDGSKARVDEVRTFWDWEVD